MNVRIILHYVKHPVEAIRRAICEIYYSIHPDKCWADIVNYMLIDWQPDLVGFCTRCDYCGKVSAEELKEEKKPC